MPSSCSTTIGRTENGIFIGDGDSQIQFTQEQMSTLFFAQVYSQSLADAFANYCKMTLASGSIPSCFREDLSKEEVTSILRRLPEFQENFADALFQLMLIFEF